jgi:methylmalonyl-CoA/ethylmalonyl-CoA epimerase
MNSILDFLADKGKSALPAGFLGDLSQIGIVSHDIERAVNGFLRLGIGPWNVYTFDKNTCTDLEFRGKPSDTVFKIALTTVNGLMWEIIQPVSGENIYTEFLAANGEGLHHLLFKCNGHDWQQKTAAFEAAGYTCLQSGKWQGTMSFAYYGTDGDTGVLLEITDILSTWIRPTPDKSFALGDVSSPSSHSSG